MRIRAVRRGTVAGVATYTMAYRSGQDIVDERTGDLYKYSWRWDVKGQGIRIPSQFEGNPDLDWARDIHILSNAMEFGEQHRKHARVAREYVLVLPREMTDEQRFNLVSGFTQALSDRNQNAIHFGIHEPRKGRAYTHHAHLTATTRKVTLDGLGEKTDAERNHDGRLVNASGLTEHRQVLELWKTHLKAAMQEAGLKFSIDRLDHNGRKPRDFDAETDGDSYASYRQRLEEEGFDINKQRREDNARSSLTPEESVEQKKRRAAIRLQEKTGGKFDKQKHEQRSLNWFRVNVPIQKALPPQRAPAESSQNVRARHPSRQREREDSLFDSVHGRPLTGEQIKIRSVRAWEAFRRQKLEVAGRQDPARARLAELFQRTKANHGAANDAAGRKEAFARSWEQYREKSASTVSVRWSEASLKNWEDFRQETQSPSRERTFSELLREKTQQIWVAYRKSLGLAKPGELQSEPEKALAKGKSSTPAPTDQAQAAQDLIAARENARRRDPGYGAQLSYGYGYG